MQYENIIISLGFSVELRTVYVITGCFSLVMVASGFSKVASRQKALSWGIWKESQVVKYSCMYRIASCILDFLDEWR